MPVIPGARVFNAPRNDASTSPDVVVCSRHWGKREPNFTFLCSPILSFASFLLKPVARHGTRTQLKSQKKDRTCECTLLPRALRSRSSAASPFKISLLPRSIGGPSPNSLSARLTFSGFAAIRYRTPIGSLHACGKIQRNSAVTVARCLNQMPARRRKPRRGAAMLSRGPTAANRPACGYG